MKLLLMLIPCIAGCLGESFYVDERFTPEEEQQIQTAADQWAAIGAEPFHFVWRQKVSPLDTNRRVIVRCGFRQAAMVSENFAAGAAAVSMRGPDHDRIMVPVESVGDGPGMTPLSRAMAHEFGHHILGSSYPMNSEGHLEDPGSVMTPHSGVVAPSTVDRKALLLTRQP